MINCCAVQIVQPGLHPNGNMVQADLFTHYLWSTSKYSFYNNKMNTFYRKNFLIKYVTCFQCFFGNSLRKFPVVDWSYEQKWTIVLLPLLLLFNGTLN